MPKAAGGTGRRIGHGGAGRPCPAVDGLGGRRSSVRTINTTIRSVAAFHRARRLVLAGATAAVFGLGLLAAAPTQAAPAPGVSGADRAPLSANAAMSSQDQDPPCMSLTAKVEGRDNYSPPSGYRVLVGYGNCPPGSTDAQIRRSESGVAGFVLIREGPAAIGPTRIFFYDDSIQPFKHYSYLVFVFPAKKASAQVNVSTWPPWDEPPGVPSHFPR
jgi:hypothetical protein